MNTIAWRKRQKNDRYDPPVGEEETAKLANKADLATLRAENERLKAERDSYKRAYGLSVDNHNAECAKSSRERERQKHHDYIGPSHCLACAKSHALALETELAALDAEIERLRNAMQDAAGGGAGGRSHPRSTENTQEK